MNNRPSELPPLHLADSERRRRASEERSRWGELLLIGLTEAVVAVVGRMTGLSPGMYVSLSVVAGVLAWFVARRAEYLYQYHHEVPVKHYKSVAREYSHRLLDLERAAASKSEELALFVEGPLLGFLRDVRDTREDLRFTSFVLMFHGVEITNRERTKVALDIHAELCLQRAGPTRKTELQLREFTESGCGINVGAFLLGPLTLGAGDTEIFHKALGVTDVHAMVMSGEDNIRDDESHQLWFVDRISGKKTARPFGVHRETDD